MDYVGVHMHKCSFNLLLYKVHVLADMILLKARRRERNLIVAFFCVKLWICLFKTMNNGDSRLKTDFESSFMNPFTNERVSNFNNASYET